MLTSVQNEQVFGENSVKISLTPAQNWTLFPGQISTLLDTHYTVQVTKGTRQRKLDP